MDESFNENKARQIVAEVRQRVKRNRPPAHAPRSWRQILDKKAMHGLLDNLEQLCEQVDLAIEHIDTLEDEIHDLRGKYEP